MNTQSTGDEEASHGKLTFRCSDVDLKDCQWQTNGDTEDGVMHRVETHLRETHGLGFDDATRVLIRRAIRRQAA
jgi:predicted small metal-binding protein